MCSPDNIAPLRPETPRRVDPDDLQDPEFDQLIARAQVRADKAWQDALAADAEYNRPKGFLDRFFGLRTSVP